MKQYLKLQDGISCGTKIYCQNGNVYIDDNFVKQWQDVPNIKPQIGIICRKDYKENYNNDISDYTIFNLANYIAVDDNPNCEIIQQEDYPRNDVNKKWYCYILYPLRDLKKGQKITVKKNSFPLNIISKTVNPLRDQPDYGQRNIQEQNKQLRDKLSKELYHDYLKISNIVYSLYNNLINGVK